MSNSGARHQCAGRLNPATVAGRGRARLLELAAFARAHSSAYREHYRHLPSALTTLEQLPPVTKPELMAQFEDWVTDPAVTRQAVETFVADPARVGQPFLGRYAVCTSSGVTGQQGLFVHDADALKTYRALTLLRGYAPWLDLQGAWAALRQGLRGAMVTATRGHFASVVWMASTLGLTPGLAGRFTRLLDVTRPIPELSDALEAFQPAFLIGYPTALALLAEAQLAGRLHIRPALVATGGEPLVPTDRARLGAAFGCPVRQVYAASECFALAFECRHGWLHVNADWAILEAVDAQYRPVPAGQASHSALLTNLANRVQPIIRYDLGDSITVQPQPCTCGNPLPAIRVEGRRDEILRLRAQDGSLVSLPPHAFIVLFERLAGVRGYQVIQTAVARLTVRLEVAPGADETVVWTRVAAGLGGYLASQGLATVEVSRANQAPGRDAQTGKFRHFWAEIKP